MPYINVDEAYVLDNTGLQVDQAVDYGLYNANRNLLDNGFFTVNQRNFTSGEGPAAGIMLVDRWKAIRATVTRNSDNSLTVTPTSANYGICQFIEQSRLKVGNTYTMSALIDNQYYSGSFVFNTSAEYFATFSNGIRFYRHTANNVTDVWVIRDSTTAFAVQAVKLELGSYSTLGNDVPPNYAEELAKCQYYYRELKAISESYIAMGYAVAATVFRVLFPYTMRTLPSISYSGTLTAYYKNGNAPVTAISRLGAISDAVQVALTTSGLTAGEAVMLNASADAKITFSADL